MAIKLKIAAFFVVFALCALLFYRCDGDEESQSPVHKRGGVVTENNTALRISPLVFSGIIDRLEKGRPVEIIDRSVEKGRIARTTDYWYYIKLDNGITGWIYGQNLRLMDIKNHKQLDDISSAFREQEAGELSKAIAGKWWSVSDFGDFTDHALELFDDGSYKSYYKGQEEHPIEGKFTVNFDKADIVFPQGTTFKQNLKFAARGGAYILFSRPDGSKEKKMNFKKIQEGAEENLPKQQNLEQQDGGQQEKNENQ